MPASKYTSTSFLLRELLAIHVQCVHALAIIGAEKRKGLFFFKRSAFFSQNGCAPAHQTLMQACSDGSKVPVTSYSSLFNLIFEPPFKNKKLP